MTKTLRNPYEVLGLSATADAAEIKTAYRRLALQYHPDRNPGDKEAEERFKEISEAYATLRDPETRARFDRFGSTRPQASRPDFNTVDWQTIFQEADIKIDWSQRGAAPPQTGNAVFDALFGAMAGMMRTSGMLPGEHKEIGLGVNLSEMRQGGVRRVRIPGPSVCATCYGKGVLSSGRMCEVCGGRGFVRSGAEVEVKIPAGAKDGLKLRLKELGGPGRPPGDAFVTLRADLPPNARLDNGTLHAELSVTPFEAERGVTTAFLGVDVTVPKGATEGQLIRVPGGGLGGQDLLATLRIGMWSGLWRRVRSALS